MYSVIKVLFSWSKVPAALLVFIKHPTQAMRYLFYNISKFKIRVKTMRGVLVFETMY